MVMRTWKVSNNSIINHDILTTKVWYLCYLPLLYDESLHSNLHFNLKWFSHTYKMIICFHFSFKKVSVYYIWALNHLIFQHRMKSCYLPYSSIRYLFLDWIWLKNVCISFDYMPSRSGSATANYRAQF